MPGLGLRPMVRAAVRRACSTQARHARGFRMKNRTTRTHIARRTGRDSPDTGMRAPHERDEASDESRAEPQVEIEVAERDIRQGRVDTDNYTRMREVGEAGLRKRR